MSFKYILTVLDSVITLCNKHKWDISKVTLIDLVIHLHVEKEYLEFVLRAISVAKSTDREVLHETLGKLYRETQVSNIKFICLSIVNMCNSDNISMCTKFNPESAVAQICLDIVAKLASKVGEYNYDGVRSMLV